MHIDVSDKQSEKAPSSIREKFQPASKNTLESPLLVEKQAGFNRSIFFGIVTLSEPPKVSSIEMPSKSTRKSPEILKWRFPFQTEIARKAEPAKAYIPNS
jgi:hypothetical protein